MTRDPRKRPIGDAFKSVSIASGQARAGSDVDMFVVGDVTLAEAASAIKSAQDRLDREINPSVYPVSEFRRKLAAGHHFLTSVMKEPRIF